MKKNGFWSILAVCALFLAFGCGRVWAEESYWDITALCKFEVGPKFAKVSQLLDGCPTSLWEAPAGREYHLRVHKPGGLATLSMLWVEQPGNLALYRMGDDLQLALIEEYGEVSASQAFVLPGEAGVYYLSTSKGMRVAEVRVHEGELKESFFATHGYPSGFVRKWPADMRKNPVRRSDSGQQVLAMKEVLQGLGYEVGELDRKFGEAAYLSLMKFQRACGLYATGVLDYGTLHALESPPSAAARSQAVELRKPLPRTASALVNFMRGKVGSAYLYGASGRECSPEYRAIVRRMYPEYHDVIVRDSHKYDGLESYDCIGLIKAFLEVSEGEYPDEWHTNVTGAVLRWLTTPEPIETMPREPGIILLQQNITTESFMHAGIYVGDGVCVHARGHRYGVVAEPMPQLWTHWARPIWLEYDLPEEPADEAWPPYMGVGDRVLVDTSTGNMLNMYSRPKARSRFALGTRIPNFTELIVEEVPENDSYFRKVSMLGAQGQLYTGYVFAKDLSVLDPPQIAGSVYEQAPTAPNEINGGQDGVNAHEDNRKRLIEIFRGKPSIQLQGL